MSEQTDQLAGIKGHRHLVWGDNTDPLHFVEIRLADLDFLIGEVERLRGLLKRLEWEGQNRWEDAACPVCAGTIPGEPVNAAAHPGHREDCWLAAVLRST